MARSSVAIGRGTTAGRKGARHSPRLVLASEALKEDLAPIEPGRDSGRLAIGGVSASLALLGLALRMGVGRGSLPADASSVTLAAAGAGMALTILPFSYSVRAAIAGSIGATLIGLGANGAGPLVIATSHSDLARLVALVALPGALLFRARYRAYHRARWVLLTALLACVPFVIDRAMSVAGGGDSALLRAGAAADVVIILTGLFGFMGDYTTGGGSVWAALVIAVLSGSIALRQLGPRALPNGTALVHLGASVTTACAATLATIGVFHLLSAGLARDARRRANLQ
jgi:hypothetical protein